MKAFPLALVTLALASLPAIASAAGNDKSSRQGGESGASGGGAGSSAGGAGSESPTAFRDPSIDGDIEMGIDKGVDEDKVRRKRWEIAGGFEYHRLWRRNDLEGAAANADVNVYSFAGTWEPTPLDKVRLRGFFYERFLADDGETGFRSDDLILSYTRTIPLPEKVLLKPGAWVTAPTSFASKKATIITVPRIYLSAEKTFKGWLRVEPRIMGEWYFVRDRTYEDGATPNVKARTGVGLNVEANVPIHRALTFGLDIGTAWYWYYDAYGSQALSATRNPNFYGTEADATYTSQPIQQTYAGEIYARYDFPAWKDIHTDATLALANGDPTIGSVSAIHDGARFFYLGWRQTAEVYAALSVRY